MHESKILLVHNNYLVFVQNHLNKFKFVIRENCTWTRKSLGSLANLSLAQCMHYVLKVIIICSN